MLVWIFHLTLENPDHARAGPSLSENIMTAKKTGAAAIFTRKASLFIVRILLMAVAAGMAGCAVAGAGIRISFSAFHSFYHVSNKVCAITED